jgi:hypothetical protein
MPPKISGKNPVVNGRCEFFSKTCQPLRHQPTHVNCDNQVYSLSGRFSGTCMLSDLFQQLPQTMINLPAVPEMTSGYGHFEI